MMRRPHFFRQWVVTTPRWSPYSMGTDSFVLRERCALRGVIREENRLFDIVSCIQIDSEEA